MFHRFGGKVFFYVLALLFFVLSIQNTWAFLNAILPDATALFVACMMVIFEGGFLGWLALLMHGSENIPRTIIAALMLLVTGAGVGTGAWFELSGEMHKGIAAKIDPSVLANVPNVVLGVYLATFVALLLYILASPHFFARMAHMNEHGHAPTNLRVYPISQTRQGQRTISEQRSAQKALPQASSEDTLPVPRSVNFLQRVGAWFSGDKGIAVDSSDAAQEADGEDISESFVDGANEPMEVQYNVASRTAQPRAHLRSTSNAARARRSPAQINRILSALDKAEPGQSDAALARQAGCSTSTVSRWRKQ